MPLSRQVNLQLLTYLEALVEECSVTRAADRTGIGQPAMSGALGRLRTVFRDPILLKTRSGMEPTPRARALAGTVHRALQMIDEASREGQPFDPLEADEHFRIIASDGVAELFLPLLMKHMREHAPKLSFSYQPGDLRRTSEYLRDDACEIVIGHVDSPASDLHHSLLYPQDAVCIASLRHLALTAPLTLEQFASHPHVAFGSGPACDSDLETQVDAAMAALGKSRSVMLRVPSVTLLPSVVAMTDMLAVVPRRIAASGAATSGIRVMPLPFAAPRLDIGMYWHVRWHRDPAHVMLRESLRQVARMLRVDSPAPAISDGDVRIDAASWPA